MVHGEAFAFGWVYIQVDLPQSRSTRLGSRLGLAWPCSNIWVRRSRGVFSLHMKRLQVTGRWRYAGPSVAMAKAIEASSYAVRMRTKETCGGA